MSWDNPFLLTRVSVFLHTQVGKNVETYGILFRHLDKYGGRN